MEIAKGVVHSPISLQLYITSQCTFLALNLTGVNSTLIRYSIWVTSTTIQLIFIPGQIQTKLPVIIGSLMRDCHFQLVDLVLSPCIEYISPLLARFSSISFIKNFVRPTLEKLIFSSVENIGRLRWFLKQNDLISSVLSPRHLRLKKASEIKA